MEKLTVKELLRLSDLLERRIIFHRSNVESLDPNNEETIYLMKNVLIDQSIFYKLEKIINEK